MKKAIEAFLFFLAVFSVQAQSFTVYTDPFPPFNYIEDGEKQGITIEVLLTIMERAGYPITREEIQFIPWARGHKIVETTPNTILITAGRTPQREELFEWIGPVSTLNIGVIAPKSRKLAINTIQDLLPYTGTCVRESAPEQLITAAGFPVERLSLVTDPSQGITMLNRGRVDFLVHVDVVTNHLLKKAGLNPDDYEMVHFLKSLDLYIAVNKDTDPKILDDLRRQFDHLKVKNARGMSEYDRILEKEFRY